MSNKEKFVELTTEQREKLATVKDATALDAFLSDNGFILTDEEKTQVLEYLKTGKQPLADEELDNVAGGAAPAPTCCQKCGSTDITNKVHPIGLYLTYCNSCKVTTPSPYY